MARKFPHLDGATDFPNTNMHPYEQYQNNIDYDDYTNSIKIKPCNVKWTPNSGNRVKWDTDELRDSWFDSLDGQTYDFDSDFDIVPETSVKLPIPLHAAQWINYLVVETAVLPNSGAPFDYQENRTKRFYYFVIGMTRAATSTTEFTLLLDSWTTFINSAEIPRIDMSRGHAAMTENVQTYLNNPIEHTNGLLDSEPDAPQNPVKITSNKFVPFDSGNLYVLLAVKSDWPQFKSLQKVGATVESSVATFTDREDRWGWQYDVNNYNWGNIADMSNINTPTATTVSNDGIRPTGYIIVAIAAKDFYNHANNIFADYPQMLQMIAACYVVGDNMFTKNDSVVFDNVEFYHVFENKNSIMSDIKLTKQMFNYPSEYSEITKMYTMPYSCIELNDNDGTMAVIRVEDTTNALKLNRQISLLYPFLDCRAFLSGVYSSGSVTYQWKNMADETYMTQIPDNGFTEFMAKYDIPTYNLFIDSQTNWALNNASGSIAQARQNAINAYHQTTKTSNTGYENAVDSANTAVSNTNRSMSTLQSNQNDTNNNNTNIANTTVTLNNDLAAKNETLNVATTNVNNDLLNSNMTSSIDMSTAMLNANNSSNALTTVVQGAGAVISAGISVAGIALAPETGGLSLGAAAAITAAGTAVSMAGNAANSVISMTQNEASTNATIEYTRESKENSTNANNSQMTLANVYTTDTTNLKNDATLEFNRLNNLKNNNLTNRNAETTNSNAANSANTSKNNAQESRWVSVDNAKISLEQSRENYIATLFDQKRGKSQIVTDSAGNALPDLYANRGVQIRIRTQLPALIKKCGDEFLQFGYTYHQNVENPELNLMKKFTFWQGEPTVYGSQIPANAINDIQNQFETGVTVWRDADMIGSSIYDNLQ